MCSLKRCGQPTACDREKRYQALDQNDQLIWNLRDLGHTVRMLSESKGGQKRVLMLLFKAGGMTQRELTERLDIKPGSASEVLGKLEAAGLIQRSVCASNRRTVRVDLTESGKEAAKAAQQERKARHSAMFSAFTQEELTELLRLLEKLNAHWNEQFYSTTKGERRE